VISRFCDRVAVMYAGEVLEQAPVTAAFGQPLHPYTANLLHCVPRLGRPPAGGRLATLPGRLPPLDDLPPGCIFAPRCPLALESCTVARPPLMDAGDGRLTACFRWRLLTEDEGQLAALQTDGPAAAPPLPGRSPSARHARPAVPAPVEAPALTDERPPLLVVDGVVKDFPGPHHSKVRAVNGVSLALDERETFGLVGESGSGKTTLARIVAGLTLPTRGRVSLEGKVLPPAVGRRDRDVFRRLQMIFQSPESSLNPRHTVREELMRPLMRLAGLAGR